MSIERPNCAWCNEPSLFIDQDCAVGARSFCTESCWAKYNAMEVKPEGHYGFITRGED